MWCWDDFCCWGHFIGIGWLFYYYFFPPSGNYLLQKQIRYVHLAQLSWLKAMEMNTPGDVKTGSDSSHYTIWRWERGGVGLKLWIICSWFSWSLGLCHCLLGLFCLSGNKSVRIVYKLYHFINVKFCWAYYYLNGEFMFS